MPALEMALHVLSLPLLLDDAFPRIYIFLPQDLEALQVRGLPAVRCRLPELHVDTDLSCLLIPSGMRTVYSELFSLV